MSRAGALGIGALIAVGGPQWAHAEDAGATPEPTPVASSSGTAAPEPSAQPTAEATSVSAPEAMASVTPEPSPTPTESPVTRTLSSSRVALAEPVLPAAEPVAPTLTHSNTTSAVVGTDAWVWGAINAPGARITTQVLVGGTWRTSQVGTADAAGNYRLPLTYGATVPGTVTFRVMAYSDRGNVASPSFVITRTPWTVGSAGTKTIGHHTFTWGSHKGIANRAVWTEVLVGGTWAKSQQQVASGTGQLTLPLTYGAAKVGTYTFRVRANSAYGVLTSPSFTLNRVPWTVGSAGEKPTNQQTFTWGTQPTAAGRQVSTQVYLNGAWSRSQVVTAGSNGTFTIPLTYGIATPGDYTYRVLAESPLGSIASEPFVLTRTFDSSLLPTVGRVSSLYGMRVHPITGIYKLHDGHDIAAPCGTPIRSWEDGIVTYAQYHNAYGYFVKVDHGDGFMTGYAHMPGLKVRVGQRVSRAEVIGAVGTTGYSTGCHLHWMAWQDGQMFNPASLY